MDNIVMETFSPSDEYIVNKRHKKRSKFKEREENGKKHRKKNSSLYCSFHGENKSNTSREFNVLKKRAKDKDNPIYRKNHHKKKFKKILTLGGRRSQPKGQLFKV